MSRRRRKKSRGFMLFMLAVVALCLFVIGKQEYKIYLIKQEQAATQKRIDALKQQKAALEAERKRLDDPRYIEKLAREDYNMVGKNEVPLFIVDEKKQAEQK
ncbi:MAG: septum formation initiator family protein [Phascolarctobacterium sp.]|nr:septum formation initiator family protein [Phascolarctobacterium sp.]